MGDITIPQNKDIFTIQLPAKYPIALIPTTPQSLASLYKTSIDTSIQRTRMTLSLVTSNLLNTFQHPEEANDTTLTITDEDEDSNQNNNSTAINLSYSVPWNNKLASI